MTLLILAFTTGLLLGGMLMLGISNLVQKRATKRADLPRDSSLDHIVELALTALVDENTNAQVTVEKMEDAVRQNVKQKPLNEVGAGTFSDDFSTSDTFSGVSDQSDTFSDLNKYATSDEDIWANEITDANYSRIDPSTGIQYGPNGIYLPRDKS